MKVLNPFSFTKVSYTPTLAVSAGALTSASATGAYWDVGQFRFFDITVTIVTNGTGSTDLSVTLPSAPTAAMHSVTGRETQSSGFPVFGYAFSGGTALYIRRTSDNTYPGADGRTFMLSGYYRTVA